MTIPFELTAAINSNVNNSTTYMTDFQQYGIPEYFETVRPGGFEDCDGYALTKRGQLLSKGFNPDDLMLCACFLPNGEGHMVLAVHTDCGWFVLCNNYRVPMIPKHLPYTWLTCSRGKQWFKLSW